jgi:hypothetical protein
MSPILFSLLVIIGFLIIGAAASAVAFAPEGAVTSPDDTSKESSSDDSSIGSHPSNSSRQKVLVLRLLGVITGVVVLYMVLSAYGIFQI